LKWDGMNWYGMMALLWLPKAHTGTSFLRKDILVCFAGSFLTSRQLVADVCINQGRRVIYKATVPALIFSRFEALTDSGI